MSNLVNDAVNSIVTLMENKRAEYPESGDLSDYMKGIYEGIFKAILNSITKNAFIQGVYTGVIGESPSGLNGPCKFTIEENPTFISMKQYTVIGNTIYDYSGKMMEADQEDDSQKFLEKIIEDITYRLFNICTTINSDIKDLTFSSPTLINIFPLITSTYKTIIEDIKIGVHDTIVAYTEESGENYDPDIATRKIWTSLLTSYMENFLMKSTPIKLISVTGTDGSIGTVTFTNFSYI